VLAVVFQLVGVDDFVSVYFFVDPDVDINS